MVATASTMLALGTQMTSFELNDVLSNELINNQRYEGHPVLLMFICNHCPFVVHIAQQMADVVNRLQGEGMAVVAISANDIINYPHLDVNKNVMNKLVYKILKQILPFFQKSKTQIR